MCQNIIFPEEKPYVICHTDSVHIKHIFCIFVVWLELIILYYEDYFNIFNTDFYHEYKFVFPGKASF